LRQFHIIKQILDWTDRTKMQRDMFMQTGTTDFFAASASLLIELCNTTTSLKPDESRCQFDVIRVWAALFAASSDHDGSTAKLAEDLLSAGVIDAMSQWTNQTFFTSDSECFPDFDISQLC
jgi:hypothetical protein